MLVRGYTLGILQVLWSVFVMADTTYIVDDMDPSVQYVGQWNHASDYNAVHNLTMSNALEQGAATTLSILFYGTGINVYGVIESGDVFFNWGSNVSASFWLDGLQLIYNNSNPKPTQKRAEVLLPMHSKRQFATEPGVPSIDILYFQSGSLPLTKHLLLVSDIGPWMYFDCFSINSTDSASLTGTQGVVTGVYPWNPYATPSTAPPMTSSSSSPSQSSSSTSAGQQSSAPTNSPAHHSEGPIIGGVVGGVAIILFAAIALLWLFRRKRRVPSHFNASDARVGYPQVASVMMSSGTTVEQPQRPLMPVLASSSYLGPGSTTSSTPLLPSNATPPVRQQPSRSAGSTHGADISHADDTHPPPTEFSSIPPPYTAH